MGVVSGLKAMQKAVAPREDREDSVKAKWLSLKDQESVNIRFLQELDADSPLYNEEDGLIVMCTEISDPNNFKRKCISTQEEEGRCFGWDMHNKLNNVDPDYKGGWRPRERVYANVLVDNGKDEPYVAIFSQGTGPKSAVPALVEFAADAEDGKIGDVIFKLKRSGAGFSDTSYLLMPTQKTIPVRKPEHVLFNLAETAYREVPYAEQAKFFGLDDSDDEGADASVNSSVEW